MKEDYIDRYQEKRIELIRKQNKGVSKNERDYIDRYQDKRIELIRKQNKGVSKNERGLH